MKISWITLRDLEYLLAVAQQRHFGKAALACHVSQPTLSTQIKKIEGFLGVEIFERTNRNVSLTELGTPIVEQARIVLEEAEKIADIAKRKSEPLTGSFRLAAIATLGPYFMPHVLAPIRKAFPQMELLLREGLTDQLLGELKKGALDAVLAARTFDESGFEVIPICEEPFLLAAPKTHPLALKTPLRTADLNVSEMVLLEDGHCLRDETLNVCPRNKRGKIRQFHATSLETLKHLVAVGAGYTLVPLLGATHDRQLRSLVSYRAFEGKPVGRTLVLVCRGRFARKDDVRRFGEFLKANLPDVSFDDQELRVV